MQQCCAVGDLKLDLIHSTAPLFLFSLAIDYTDAQQKTATTRGSSAESEKQKKPTERRRSQQSESHRSKAEMGAAPLFCAFSLQHFSAP